MGKVLFAVILTVMAGYLGIMYGLRMNVPEFGTISAITVMGACIIFYNNEKNNP